MKKTGLIFSIVSIYIVAAFAWWTYSHIRNSRIMRIQNQEQVETLCYKATVMVNASIQQGTIRDSNDVKLFFASRFPDLEILFADEEAPLDNFLIRPSVAAYQRIEKQYTTRLWMYTLEGIVMMSLLFWGIILIYRSFLSRIQLKRQQSNFLISVTHKLKTPLASIKLYLETLLKRKVSDDQQGMIIKNSLQDVSRLGGLVDNMLLAAQLENQKYEPDLKKVDLSNLLHVTIDQYAAPRNLFSRIVKDITPGISVTADADALVMVINNLLSNAVKYAPPDARIDTQLKHEGGNVVLRVCNDGQCIPDNDKKFIFDRFYRAEEETKRNTKGTGLGLFIVKNLLTLHGAIIDVKDKKPSGVIFTITFKKDAA